MSDLKLQSLVGRHFLNTAAIMGEYNLPKNGWRGGERVGTCSIGIDGCTYTFFEDPSDGYRSYMGAIEKVNFLSDNLKGAAVINRHVLIRDVPGRDKDMIEIIDVETGHVWALLGTDNYDDYYPTCVMEWNAMPPEADVEVKKFTEKTAQGLAEAFGYDEVMVYGKRNHVEHVASFRIDVC